MRLLKIYKNIDTNNKHSIYRLSTKFYNSMRDRLINNHTIIVCDEKNELIDDNV